MAHYEGQFIRTPLAHAGGAAGTNLYMGGICANIELNLSECMEAYGYHRGIKYCRGFLEDLNECQFRTKQIRRRDAMEKERNKQYKAGKIKERYLPPPPLNSY